MQEELNSRTMTLVIETGRLTTQVLQQAIRESLHLSKKTISSIISHLCFRRMPLRWSFE